MHCEHESCHCQSEVGIVQEGQRYCSDYCADAPKVAGEACRCGHAGCSAEEGLSESA
jgi:hypothetical protein